MTISHDKLADKYHTTKLPGNLISLIGKYKLVGIDVDEQEMPKGRFIWFHIHNPQNKGGVLFGMAMCDYRVKNINEIRSEAIRITKSHIDKLYDAEFCVDMVIKKGGMLL